ncbi:MAG TPA: hypothetical protein VLX91_10595 [Candidatus Acidoferrales bacterium]|nr:hypothetical protein [Candidatus Acidoferrales bacterium]
MSKKVWLGFVAVFIVMEIIDFLVNGVILMSTLNSLQGVWRSDMSSKMWIFHVINIFSAFFFTFIFSKGFEKKGIMEGVRYGFYIGVWMSVGMAYGTYAMIAIPYSLALQWFIYGVIEYIILGVVLALIFKEKSKEVAS